MHDCEACAKEKAWLEAERALFLAHDYRRLSPPPVESVVGRAKRDRTLRWVNRGATVSFGVLSLAAGFWVALNIQVPDPNPEVTTAPEFEVAPVPEPRATGGSRVVVEGDPCTSLARGVCDQVCDPRYEEAVADESESTPLEPVLWSGGTNYSSWSP